MSSLSLLEYNFLTKKRIAQNFLLFRKQRRKVRQLLYTRGIMTLRLFPIQDGHLPDEF
jgi:hypothetical protein